MKARGKRKKTAVSWNYHCILEVVFVFHFLQEHFSSGKISWSARAVGEIYCNIGCAQREKFWQNLRVLTFLRTLFLQWIAFIVVILTVTLVIMYCVFYGHFYRVWVKVPAHFSAWIADLSKRQGSTGSRASYEAQFLLKKRKNMYDSLSEWTLTGFNMKGSQHSHMYVAIFEPFCNVKCYNFFMIPKIAII